MAQDDHIRVEFPRGSEAFTTWPTTTRLGRVPKDRLARTKVYQTIGIKGAGQPQQNKAGWKLRGHLSVGPKVFRTMFCDQQRSLSGCFHSPTRRHGIRFVIRCNHLKNIVPQGAQVAKPSVDHGYAAAGGGR